MGGPLRFHCGFWIAISLLCGALAKDLHVIYLVSYANRQGANPVRVTDLDWSLGICLSRALQSFGLAVLILSIYAWDKNA